ncbi:hypothetical protein Pelo_472 [Pelomyxa schiedti]|nr:hypothetical protein Pelo_472 [Pelomyxa schiedti]
MGTEQSTLENDKAENNGAVETRDDDVDGLYAPNKPAIAAAAPPIPARQGVWRTRSHILQVHDGKMVTSVDPEMLTREQVGKKPYVISFIGETQEGKSFLLGKILECFRWSKSGLPRPAVGNETDPETKGIDFYSCDDMFFLDYEGTSGETPREECIVGKIFPRLAYAVSSTLVFVTKKSPANKTTFPSLIALLKGAADLESKEAYEKPHLIIVFNRCDAKGLTIDTLSSRNPVGFPSLLELFSSITPYCVPDKNYTAFPVKIRGLKELLRGKGVQLPARQWIYLFESVVSHFNRPELTPVPLCKLYCALLDKLPRPLDRLQQLFLTNIPNRMCTEDSYTQHCTQVLRAVAFVLAAHYFGDPTPSVNDDNTAGRVALLLEYLAKFAPCTICGVQHCFHSSSIAHEGHFNGHPLDHGKIQETTLQTKRFLEALTNASITIKYNPELRCFNEAAQAHAYDSLVSEFNTIHKFSRDCGTALVTGASVGALIAFPPAILVSSSVVGAPFGLLIICAGAAVGGTLGILVGPVNSTDVTTQERVRELMEAAALQAYAKGHIHAVVVVKNWRKVKIAEPPKGES